MRQWLLNLKFVVITKDYFAERQRKADAKTPKYLSGDMSKHRLHTTKYEDLCK
jgi:hypothetical protein